MNPSYDLGHRTRVPGYHWVPWLNARRTFGRNSRGSTACCAPAAEIGFSRVFHWDDQKPWEGSKFGEKPACFRCVVRCILYIRIWIYFWSHSQTCYLRMWKLWQFCLVSRMPSVFKRCLWDELIFSRYAFNDDDKKVPGRLGSFFWGPVRPGKKPKGPTKKNRLVGWVCVPKKGSLVASIDCKDSRIAHFSQRLPRFHLT